jgi:putative phosphoribosyl transferase
MSNAPPPRETRSSFRDRAEAGLLLGEKVREVLGLSSSADFERSRFFASPAPRDDAQRGRSPLAVRVFAIPRGGVAVGAGVARCLGVPLDVIVVRKIGHPDAPEYGLGAIAEGGEPVFDAAVLAEAGLRVADLAEVVRRERVELARRVAVYRGGVDGPAPLMREPLMREPLTGPSRPGLAIVVDDGLATGVTARAALRAVAGSRPVRTVLAVPVAAEGSLDAINAEADEVVTVVTARRLRSVGEWYVDFGQLTDADVLTLLSSSGGV